MAHLYSRWCTVTRNVSIDWFAYMTLNIIRCGNLARATNFTDQHNLLYRRILLKQLQAINKAAATNHIAANPNYIALANTRLSEKAHCFVGERTTAADDGSVAWRGERGRDDAKVVHAGDENARAVGADQN